MGKESPCEKEWKRKHSVELRAYDREWSEKNREKEQEYQRKYKQANPDLNRIHSQKWKRQNPQKVDAERKAQSHVPSLGTTCSICGSNEGIERHHPDYSKPLEVVFLCAKHHPKNVAGA
jgi:hypothetical protein